MATAFKWKIEKYSRCYPPEQHKQPAAATQSTWVHLSNRAIELCLDGISNVGTIPDGLVPQLKIVAEGQVVLELLSLSIEIVKVSRVKVMVKGPTMGFRYFPTASASNNQEARKFQIKFLTPEDCFASADVLGRYIPCKSIIGGIGSVGDTQLTQPGGSDLFSSASSSSQAADWTRSRVLPVPKVVDATGGALAGKGPVAGRVPAGVADNSSAVREPGRYGARSEMLPPRSVTSSAISSGVSVTARAMTKSQSFTTAAAISSHAHASMAQHQDPDIAMTVDANVSVFSIRVIDSRTARDEITILFRVSYPRKPIYYRC
ncbi:hypothetical protein BC936DRAFT_140196 [Jimgerdemannia flammicorona]|uniref:Uncharacterized protein n=1 Tax=Jimgerdemannia flammicorona TaxID=994334 RepID=A0A433AXH9_9FUNG|nr:hypothetical protein BC936DRAFT_140196 [Jimgerdemannia flammicorona]